MKSFGSLMDMSLHLAAQVPVIALELERGLGRVAKVIEDKAKAEIGHYQDAAGPFPAWPLLADSTEDEKAKAGYPTDAPLLRTGEMRESITHEVHGLEAVIGSPDERMVYHEFGTSHMPARPVLGPAAFTSKDAIIKLVGAAAVAGLIGKDQISAALGYDMTVTE